MPFPSGGGSGAVDSVNAQTGVVVLDYVDVGAASDPHDSTMHSLAYANALAGVRLLTGPTTYPVAIGDGVLVCDCTAGPVTITLPAIAAASPLVAGSVGTSYEVVKIDPSVNAVTIAPTGTDTIRGLNRLARIDDAAIVFADTTSGAPFRWLSAFSGSEPDLGLIDQLIAPAGSIASTIRRTQLNSLNQGIGGSGVLKLSAIPLLASMILTNIVYVSGTTAAVAPTNWWFALYDESLNLIRQTADQGAAAWTADTVKTLAMSSPYTVPSSGLYYVGIMMAAGTVVSVIGWAGTGTVGPALTPIGNGTSTGGLTTTAPDPAGAITPHASTPYAYMT